MKTEFISKRQFGIELEVEATTTKEIIKDVISEAISKKRYIQISDFAKSSDNDYWHVKYDATCGPLGKPIDHGWEVASFVASGQKDIQEIYNVVQALNKNLQVNNNCGFHIHAQVGDLSFVQLVKIAAYWLKYEKLLTQLVPVRRIKNVYCRLLTEMCIFNRNTHYTPEEVWKFIKPSAYADNLTMQRRVTLNLTNCAKKVDQLYRHFCWCDKERKTIELRMPEGTLNANDVKCWIYLFLSFIEASIAKPFPKNLSPISKLDSIFSFLGLNKNLSEEMEELKSWMLDRVIVFSRKRNLRHGSIKKLACNL